LEQFRDLPGFPVLFLRDPEDPFPDAAGSALLRKNEVVGLEHTTLADAHERVHSSERDPLIYLFAHVIPVRQKAETHHAPPAAVFSRHFIYEYKSKHRARIKLSVITF